MDAVKEYKKRRRARLAANILRLDDDEETNNQNQGKGNHGNTRIPFGLCQREGIQIGKGWTPKDAWSALEGKGYSASSVYKELKKEGKVSGKKESESSDEPKEAKAPKIDKAQYAKLKKDYKSTESEYNKAKLNREAQDQALANATRNVDETAKALETDDTHIERYRDRIHLIDNGVPGAASRWDRDEMKRYLDYWTDQKVKDTKILAERQKYRDAAIKAQTDAANKENELKAKYDEAKEAYSAPIKSSPEYNAVKEFRANEEELMFARRRYNDAENKLRIEQSMKSQAEKDIEKYKSYLKDPENPSPDEALYARWVKEAEKRYETHSLGVEDASKEFAEARKAVVDLESKSKPKSDFDDEMWQDAYSLTTDESVVNEVGYTTLSRAAQQMKTNNVTYNPVHKFFYSPTEEEAIEYIGGGDETSGSCVSCAMAYLACKKGYNVLDFRGGSSQSIMSVQDRSIMMALGGKRESDKDGYKATHRILDTVEDGGKEYFFVSGSHAAIVKKENGELKYLELQDRVSNGWFPLNDNVLKRRFSCHHSRTRYGRTFDCESFIIDADKLTESDEYISLLGYINTEPGKQKKGRAGGVK